MPAVHDLKIRVPKDVKRWLLHRAEMDNRSMNGFVLQLLKSAQENEALATRETARDRR